MNTEQNIKRLGERLKHLKRQGIIREDVLERFRLNKQKVKESEQSEASDQYSVQNSAESDRR